MKNRNINKIVSKVLKETLEDKIEGIESEIENMNELEESHDDPFIYQYTGGKKYNPIDYKEIPLGKGEIGIDQDMLDRNTGVTIEKDFTDEFLNQMDLRDLLGDDGITGSDDDDDFEPIAEGKEMCEQCGKGSIMEGECSECGYKMESSMDENIHKTLKFNKKNKFDYIEEDTLDFEDFDSDPIKPNVEGCKATMEIMRRGEDCPHCEEILKNYNCDALNESLSRRQKKYLDKNKNNKIDSEDFKLLRKGKKKETKEGKKFPDLSGDGKVTRKDILMGRGVKFGKKKNKVKESVELTEEEMIDLIENIVNEQKSKETKLRPIGKPRGLETYEKAHKGSGKENEDYIKSVAKKMKEYLKDGSKAEYSDKPKHFPKGNGQLAKMKTTKYSMSDKAGEFLDDYFRPGMENLDYDEIHPNEDWMKDNIEGSSKTGNNPKWANAEETELGKKINKKRKENKYAKAKRKAYNKSPQPIISDEVGNEDGDGVNMTLESENIKQLKMLNEEFSRINNLMSYNRKTQ